MSIHHRTVWNNCSSSIKKPSQDHPGTAFYWTKYQELNIKEPGLFNSNVEDSRAMEKNGINSYLIIRC